MKKLADLPDSPLNRLVDVDSVNDESPELIRLINDSVEKALQPQKGYTTDLPYVFSRNQRNESPDWLYSASGGLTTRLLDSPTITSDLIERTALHVNEKLDAILRECGGIQKGRARLPHTINSQKHTQKATLLSYMMRAFCPDTTPALSPFHASYVSEEDIDRIMLALPLDPEKLSDEVLELVGLVPDDFQTYTLQARLRYKLWIRKQFFEILSRARIFSRSRDDAKESSTARIIAFYDANGRLRVGNFINQSGLHIHQTGQKKPRIDRKKIMKTHFRIFEDFYTFLRSQDHATESLFHKGENVGVFSEMFSEFSELGNAEQEELIIDALEYFWGKPGFYEKKIVEFLQKLAKNPGMISHINRNFSRLSYDIHGKYSELKNVTNILRELLRQQEERKRKMGT